jgi:predicted enzyme related to lactoylglutathione lyase
MAKVLGIGGVFFKSADPEKLLKWYEKRLGFKADPQSGITFLPQDMPENSLTVWSVFPATTTYFAPSGKEFMFNLVVDDLDGALQQIKEGGGQVVGAVDEFDYGRFGWFMDSDGNKVELWEPKRP